MLIIHRTPGNKNRDKFNLSIDGHRIAQIKIMEIIDDEVVVAITAPETVDISRAEVRPVHGQ